MANSHKRDLLNGRRRTVAIAAPIAALTTIATIAVGVTSADDSSGGSELQAVDTSQVSGSSSGAGDRREVVSRTGRDRDVREGVTIKREPTKAEKMMRDKAVKAAVAQADTKLWTTTVLNLWTRPDGKARKLGVIDEVKKVLVTGREHAERQEIVIDGHSRWVTAGYLDDEKPVTEEAEESGGGAAEGTGGTCTNGSSVASGVSGSIVEIHQAVCARWPEISTYGTLRADSGDHGSGRAVDIMISGETGWAVAEYLRANASAFGISYIIYSQQIWSVDRGGEGWRGMSDRGSTTANHYDHVHVSVY